MVITNTLNNNYQNTLIALVDEKKFKFLKAIEKKEIGYSCTEKMNFNLYLENIFQVEKALSPLLSHCIMF